MFVYASNVAYFLILSCVPLLLLLFSLISIIPQVTIDQFTTELNSLVPNIPQINHSINIIYNIAKSFSTSNILSINIISAIITTSGVIFAISIGLTNLHDINISNSFIKAKLFSILNMILFIALMIFAIIIFLLGNILSTYIQKYFPHLLYIINNILGFKYPIAFTILFLFLLSSYTVSINFKRKIKTNIIGALISTILWVLSTNIFSLYFNNFSNSKNNIYGSLYGLVIIMIWLFVTTNIIFIGATINEVIYPQKNQ